MIITLLACIYITFVCLMWGAAVMNVFNRQLPVPGEISPVIITFLGLAVITTFSGLLSLFVPLGGLWIQVFLLVPALIYFFIAYSTSRRLIKGFFTGLSNPFSGWILSFLFLILLMSSWKIIHPDTLGYHAQVIKWIEEHKAVPGIVNLQTRLGLQNTWFVACAVFSFTFTGSLAVTYINSAVVIWMLLFAIQQINRQANQGKELSALGGVLLLGICLWSYTMIRLTVTSASPDFIAAIITALVFFLFLSEKEPASPILIILLGIFAITIKLSAAPVILVVLYPLIKVTGQKKNRTVLIFLATGLIILLPFITRNIISSGYPLFPSGNFNFIEADWKIPEQKVADLQHYITGYAKGFRGEDIHDISNGATANLSEWVPVWWNHLSLSDRAILILLVLLLIAGVFRFRSIMRAELKKKYALLTTLAGALFWFIYAPDPRFGYGFTISLMAILFYILIEEKRKFNPNFIKIRTVAIYASILLINAYTVYRFVHFFQPAQVLFQAGIMDKKYKKVKRGPLEINIPADAAACGNCPLPCTSDSSYNWIPRGANIEDGFRPATNP